MTRGTWLAGLARGLVHPETFSSIVSPAIADLQFEAALGRTDTRLSHYVGVWVAVSAAVVHDVFRDSRPPAWSEPLALVIALVLLQFGYYGALVILAFSAQGAAAASVGFSGVLTLVTHPHGIVVAALAVVLTLIPIAACVLSPRRISRG